VSEGLKMHPEIDPATAVRAVFSTMLHKLPKEELIKLSNVLPKEIRYFLNEACS